jgi:hypothetical protein
MQWKACGIYGRHEKCIQSLAEKLKGREHLENLAICVNIILK